MRILILAGVLMAVAPVAPLRADPSVVAAPIAAAVSWPGRPPADVARDGNRHPAALLALAAVKPGDKVADLMPGSGYFTRLFSRVVGPSGHVYAIVPAELAHAAPKTLEMVRSTAAEPGLSNVSMLVVPAAQIAAPEKLDLVWTSDNYHDVYGFFGAAEAAAMDRAVFAALKPGGHFIVVDHVAAAGTSGTAPTTLHRIDPATVRAQVLAAGFVESGTSDALHRADDDHSRTVFDPSVRGHTDQFAFSFLKPIKTAE